MYAKGKISEFYDKPKETQVQKLLLKREKVLREPELKQKRKALSSWWGGGMGGDRGGRVKGIMKNA